MGVSILAVVGIAVVLVIILALALGGGRALPWIVGLLALGALAGVGLFAFRAPTQVVMVPATPQPAPATAPQPDPNADRVGDPGSRSSEGEASDGATLRAVSGRVYRGAEGEEPAEGARIEVFGEASGLVPFATPLARAEAGADGSFRVEGIPAKVVRVRASLDDLAPDTETVEEDEEEATLRLLPASWIAGRVLDGEAGTPVVGAHVTVEDAVGSLSGEDGAFRIEGVPVDRVLVTATAEGFAPESESVKVPAEGKDGVTLHLTAATSVAGTVFGPDGSPVAGAKVSVESTMDAPFVGSISMSTSEGVSGEDGKYRIEGIEVGRKVKVSAATDDALSPKVEAGPLRRGEPAEGVDLHLAPAAVVVVTVRDGAGAPVEGASVSATPVEEGEEEEAGPMAMVSQTLIERRIGGTETDAEGVARIRPVVPGPVKVAAWKEDWKRSEKEAVAGAGVETGVALVLDPGAVLIGRVVDSSGAPVPEAEVTARRFGMGEFSNESRTAGEDGAFRIGGLDDKGYTVSAEAEGFVSSSLNNVKPSGGEVVLTLQRAGVIVGTAVDPDGQPVPKMRVAAERTDAKDSPNPMDFSRFAGAVMGDAQEDPEGRFRIEGLAPGTYTVTVRAKDLAPGRVESVAVEAGGETAVEVVLPEGLTLRGLVVRKADGVPVEGARVVVPEGGLFGQMDMDFDVGEESGELGEQMEEARSFMEGSSKGAAVTGADGRFAIRGLEAGTVGLKVKASGMAPTSVKGVEVPASADVRVEMNEEGAIEGTVFDAEGIPKAGAMVMLQRLPTFMRMATTDDAGHYRVGGLPGGAYLFYVMENRNAFAGGGFNLKSETVRIEEGKTLRKDHRVGEGTKVTGRVTKGGKPVSGVMVMLMPGGGDSSNPMSAMMGGGGGGGGFAMGSTNKDGVFEISGVAPGKYTLAVQSGMGGGLGGGESFVVARGAREVRQDVQLPQNAIRGQVVDESGRPVSGAQVMAVQSGKSLSHVADMGSAIEAMGGQTFTDDDGRFAIEDMKPGSYTLQVQASGYGTAAVENVVAVEGGGDVRVTLEKGREVTVRVLGPEGQAVRGAGIFLTDAQGRELSNLEMFDAVRTGEDGTAVVRAPSGRITFEAVAAGFGPGTVAVDVPPPGEVTVRLPRGAGVEATVVGPGGSPAAGVAVELLDGEGSPYRQRFSMENLADLMGGSSTGPGGSWTRKDLPAGTYRVRATLDGRTGEEKVVLAAGEVKQVTVRIP